MRGGEGDAVKYLSVCGLKGLKGARAREMSSDSVRTKECVSNIETAGNSNG